MAGWSLLTLATLTSLLVSTSAVETTNLTRYLLRNYDKIDLPGGEVNMKFSMKIISIDLYQANDVQVNTWMTQSWTDKRLSWNPSSWSNIDRIFLPASLLWKPDIVLYYQIRDTTTVPTYAVVYSSGLVMYIPQVRLTPKCAFDSASNGNDVNCQMALGSWVYDGDRLNVTFDETGGLDLSEYWQNPDWYLADKSVKRIKITYPCCPEPYITLRYSLRLNRVWLRPIATQFSVVRAVALLTPFVFLTQRRQLLRLLLSALILVSFSLCSSSAESSLDKSGYSLYSYTWCNLILMLICFVIHLLPRYEESRPDWIKKLCPESKKQQSVELNEQKQQQEQQQQEQAGNTNGNRILCLLFGCLFDTVCFAVSLLVSLLLLSLCR